MTFKTVAAVLGTALFSIFAPAHAALIKVDVEFQAENFGPLAPFDPVSGSFSFIYDAALIDPLQAVEQTVSDFMLDIRIGATQYSAANSDIRFTLAPDGDLIFNMGAVAGGIGSPGEGTNDFSLMFLEGPSSLFIFNYTVEGSDQIFDDLVSNFTLTETAVPVSEVPLPGALALMVTGLAGIGLMRRRRARA